MARIDRPGVPQEGNLDLQRQIARWQEIERAHDDYLAVMRETADHAARLRERMDRGELQDRREYWLGWLACLRTWEGRLVQRARERADKPLRKS